MNLDLAINTGLTLALTIGASGLSLDLAPTRSVEIPLTVVGGSVGGDMRASVYDPRDIMADIFDLANHTGTIDTPSVTIDGGLI